MNWPVLPNANASPLASLESVLAGAWDADLLSEVTALLQPYEANAATTSDDDEDDEDVDEEEEDDEDDRINDSDLAILNQLLATRNDVAQYQLQHQPIAPATAPAPAPSDANTKGRNTAKNAQKDQSAPDSTAVIVDEKMQFTGRTTRERRKEELVYLRAKALELEAKLKQHKERRQQDSERDQQKQLARSGPSRYAALWMKLAKRQEEERRQAQVENTKLRQLVVSQVRLARSLDRVLRKRMVRAFDYGHLVSCWCALESTVKGLAAVNEDSYVITLERVRLLKLNMLWEEHADALLLHEVASLLSPSGDSGDASVASAASSSALFVAASPMQQPRQSSEAANNTSHVDADADLAQLNALLDAQMQRPFPSRPEVRAALSLPKPIPVPTVAAALDAHPPPPPSLLEAPLTSAKQGAKTTRERQKEELLLLRAQVVELEAQLESHKQLHREIAALKATVSVGDNEGESTSWWARAATHQFEEKSRAEAENNRLRDMALGQLRLAKSLEKVLEKRRMWEDMAQPTIKRPRSQGSANSGNENYVDDSEEEEPEDAAIFASLRDAINSRAQSDDVDALLKTHGLDALVKDSAATDISHDEQGMHLDFKIVKLYPFDYREVNDAAWQITQRELINQGQHGSGRLLESTDNLVVMKLRVTPKPNMPLTLRSMFKRISETDRVVYMYETQAESAAANSGSGHQAFPALSYRERGWLTMSPISVPNVSVVTVTKLFTRLTPTFATATATGNSQSSSEAQTTQMTGSGVLTDLLIALHLQSVRRSHETMQDLLVDNHVASKLSATTSSQSTMYS